MRALLVNEIMTTDVVTLDVDENLDVADTVMNLARIRHLPVVNEGKLVGLVTHRDLLAAQASTMTPEDRDLNKYVMARQIMRSDVRTVAPDSSILDAARLMQEFKYGCLPVVDDGQLVGIITEADFLDLVIHALEEGAESKT
jgi:CBS domain-containing membrane protein